MSRIIPYGDHPFDEKVGVKTVYDALFPKSGSEWKTTPEVSYSSTSSDNDVLQLENIRWKPYSYAAPSATILPKEKHDYHPTPDDFKSLYEPGVSDKTEYIFNEDRYLKEALDHITKTYSGHYSGKVQATELIFSSGHGIGFCVGDIIKYASRLGKKNGWNRADVLKIIHYATMLLHVIDTENTEG